jgi:hypothetical protein
MAAKCGALLPFAASAAVCACNEAFTAAAAIFPSSTNMLQKYPKMRLHKSIFFYHSSFHIAVWSIKKSNFTSKNDR